MIKVNFCFLFYFVVSFCVSFTVSSAQADDRKKFFSDLESFRAKSLRPQVQQTFIAAAEDALRAKKLFWTPDLSLALGQTDSSLNGLNVGNRNYLQAAASINIFKSGQDLMALERGEYQLKAQQSQRKSEDLDVEMVSAQLIFKSLYLKQSKKVQEDLRRMKTESLRIVKERYSQGKTPQQEVTKVEVDLNQQNNKIRSAQIALSENEMEIKNLFVRSVQTESWPFSDKTKTSESREAKNFTLEKMYWQSRSKELEWQSQRREHGPRLDLSFQAQEFPARDRDNREVVTLLELKLPIWSKFETTAASSAAFAAKASAEADYLGLQQATENKKEFLALRLELSRQSLKEAQNNLQKSQNLYQNMVKNFSLGRISANDLFLEQNRILESESDLFQSLIVFHQTLVETCHIQGSSLQECIKD